MKVYYSFMVGVFLGGTFFLVLLKTEAITKEKVLGIKEEIVEVEVKRSRKSEIRRTERINVKKFAYAKASKNKKSDDSNKKD